MRITALAGGIGGARFLQGLLRHLEQRTGTDHSSHEVTVIGNTGDDIWVHGLRVCPDLDTVMYTLGGGIDTTRGWGRQEETFHAKEELAAYGVEPTWFGLGDRDIGTHLVRTASLNAGYSLSAVTSALCERWQPGVQLLPMSDDRAETHVVVDDPDNPGHEIALHFQEWWIKHRARLPARGFVMVGIENAQPAPGVLEAINTADVIVFPPSNPIVSIGSILAVPGIRDAIVAAPAPVVGVSPIVSGAPVRGMADACLQAEGIDTSAAGVATHYGSRASGGLLDAWLVDTSDAAAVPAIAGRGIACRAVPLLMTDIDASAQIASDAFALVADSRNAG
ncbi:MAG TPA: 2-phospho-L-lactate transferase [Candidatus Nanopelagicales bacterium]|nr:2-phospho-L-lactate transferase [Candidatus Nanopelagicales bacterium]